MLCFVGRPSVRVSVRVVDLRLCLYKSPPVYYTRDRHLFCLEGADEYVQETTDGGTCKYHNTADGASWMLPDTVVAGRDVKVPA